MRWAVLGNKGMFGADQFTHLVERGEIVEGFNRNNLNLALNETQLAKRFEKYDVLINAIAFTNVDLAETNKAEAFEINGQIAGKLANVSALLGSKFIHLSTDYVFDGTGTAPYRTDDLPHAINVYGESKLLGEQLVARSGGNHSVVRTAWLYGNKGKSFPKTIATKLIREGFVEVINDQWGQPTWTMDVARCIWDIARLDVLPKIFHAVSEGTATRADQARAVAGFLDISEPAIHEIASDQFVSPAIRPKWSVLETSNEVIPAIGEWSARWNVAAPTVLEELVN
jgi:dTDP-4-dehydrorhamnose reductase